jgi:propionyl-CoA synthetase
MASYKEFHKRSIEDRNGFWGEQAELIHWNKKPEQIYDFSKPPFVKWFVGGETNLCYNAVDRHAETNPNGKALVYISTETDEEKPTASPSCAPKSCAWRRSTRASASRRATAS